MTWFSSGTPVSPTNKTDCYDITEILLKVALNTITITLKIHDHIRMSSISSMTQGPENTSCVDCKWNGNLYKKKKQQTKSDKYWFYTHPSFFGWQYIIHNWPLCSDKTLMLKVSGLSDSTSACLTNASLRRSCPFTKTIQYGPKDKLNKLPYCFLSSVVTLSKSPPNKDGIFPINGRGVGPGG